MENIIEDFKLSELKEPKFIQASLVNYKQNGVAKTWEVVKAHDSVAILIYHREHNSFVLVKQFRPAVYMKNGNGLTVEMCAGIIDKELSIKEIASEEIMEECGYLVDIDSIKRITAVNSAVGFAGSKQTIFYVEVDEAMRVGSGGGVDSELIEVIEIPVDEVREFIYNEDIAKTTGLLFAIFWWLDKFKK